MKRKALKITAFILALALIGGIGFFANALVGNPISKFLANRSAEKYISETYPEGDFLIRDVRYDFKVGGYYAKIYSPRSIDSDFELRIDFFGKVHYDTYEYSVLTGENTAQRINKEYREAVDRVLNSTLFPYNSNIGYGDIEFIPEEYKDNFDVPSYAIVTESLVPDAIYDINEMGRKAGHLTIYVADDELTPEKMAEVLLGLKDIFDRSGVGFHAINCVIENRKEDVPPSTDIKQIEVQHFLYSDIYEKNLTERIEKSIRETEEYYREMDKIKEQEILDYQNSLTENAE
ncbi:MAG: hypothetical protein IIW88_04090 [Clostridia bacterium]|nr:hypothetical protein [Clostridia bacterium]